MIGICSIAGGWVGASVNTLNSNKRTNIIVQGGHRSRGEFKRSIHEKPLISVITVVFNGEKHLEQTIQSVLDQNYENIEYLIIDGGSTDRTLEIIQKYEDRIDYWVSEPDKGIYDAMNKGIDLAKGELIGLLNSDDYYAPDAIESVVAAYLRQKGPNIYFGDATIIQDDLGISFRWHSDLRYWRGMSVVHPAMFVHREVYDSLGRYDLRWRLAADYEFFLRALTKGILFIAVKRIIVNFRNTGLTAKNLLASLNEGRRANKTYFGVTSLHHCRFLFFFLRGLFFIGLQKMMKVTFGKAILNKVRKFYIMKVVGRKQDGICN